ncbi:AAA family ATPase [Actinoplanes sichuanensis]|uniref:AAA family ATPase n=1 Tax=Actinoplanes sichuanensis TaxID=512349 RepID=A0ABW4A2N7_9ACTN|nr:AAA family ATPase [Actinoplanes sichuanensis]
MSLVHDPDVDHFAGDGPPPGVTVRAGLAWMTLRGSAPGAQPILLSTLDVATGRIGDEGPWNANPAGWCCVGYGPFRRLTGNAQPGRTIGGPADRLVSLFDEDAPLAEGVGWLIRQHLRALEGRPGARALKDLALAVLGDGLLPDGYRIEGVDSEGLWVATGDHRFPLKEMSDGYRAVAALVVDLIRHLHETYGRLATETADGSVVVTVPAVVLIDEVDAHLHVSWQKRIGNWLKRHFPRIQFIVTTHSPYICQAADENGLIRLPGPDEDEPPRVVEQDLYERIVYGSGDDAVMSELFGLDTPYSDEAVRLRRELIVLETEVLVGRADDAAVRRYEELRGQLTSSPAARAEELAAGIIADAEQRRS